MVLPITILPVFGGGLNRILNQLTGKTGSVELHSGRRAGTPVLHEHYSPAGVASFLAAGFEYLIVIVFFMAPAFSPELMTMVMPEPSGVSTSCMTSFFPI